MSVRIPRCTLKATRERATQIELEMNELAHISAVLESSEVAEATQIELGLEELAHIGAVLESSGIARISAVLESNGIAEATQIELELKGARTHQCSAGIE
jgi:hypothetical protein